jgi:hypothetical protein
VQEEDNSGRYQTPVLNEEANEASMPAFDQKKS